MVVKKICFHVIKYFPSLGGTELLAKQVVDHIVSLKKYDITVKTSPEVNRIKKEYLYSIKEDLYIDENENYDLNLFFSDLWSPQLNNYKIKNNTKNICILNLDEITYNWKNKFNNAIENLKKFDLVLTFSKDGIANKFLEEENIKNKYIPNFSRDILSTTPVFNLKEKLNIDNNKKIGLYCAAFDKRKNQLYFLNMINNSIELKNYIWIFIGNQSDKNYHHECINYSKKNNLKNVFFLASTTDVLKLNSLFQQVDFITLFSTAEGTPLTLLEACSANKPFIFTPVGGSNGVFKECLNNGAYGLKKINYDKNDVLENIEKAIIYNSLSLRDLWIKNHNKDNILKIYENYINKVAGD